MPFFAHSPSMLNGPRLDLELAGGERRRVLVRAELVVVVVGGDLFPTVGLLLLWCQAERALADAFQLAAVRGGLAGREQRLRDRRSPRRPPRRRPAAVRRKSRRFRYSFRSVISELRISAGFLISIRSWPVGRRRNGAGYRGPIIRSRGDLRCRLQVDGWGAGRLLRSAAHDCSETEECRANHQKLRALGDLGDRHHCRTRRRDDRRTGDRTTCATGAMPCAADTARTPDSSDRAKPSGTTTAATMAARITIRTRLPIADDCTSSGVPRRAPPGALSHSCRT